MFKLFAPSASPLTAALRRVLAISSLPAETLSTSERFSVTFDDGKEFLGISPMLRAVSSAKPQPVLFGSSAAERAAVNQWVTLALQVSTSVASIDDAEYVLTKDQQFLAGGSEASAADLLFYAVAAKDVIAAGSKKCPKLTRWLGAVEKQSALEGLKVERAAAPAAQHKDPMAKGDDAAAAKADGGKPKFAVPTAEEIAERKAAKEKAKAEKEKAKAAAEAAKAAAAGSNSAEEAPPLLDLRVGKITSIAKHPEAEKLYCETIEVGEEKPRGIVSGLVPFYKAEELDGSLCLVVCNMKPKKLVGTESNGMVLCASDGEKLQLVVPPEGTEPGTQVIFGAHKDQPRAPIGKKTMDFVADLKTDSEGNVVWKNMPLSVPRGPLTSSMKNVPVK